MALSTASARASALESTSSSTSDRKSTRLNSSHLGISYAVFCLKKKNAILQITRRRSLNEWEDFKNVIRRRSIRRRITIPLTLRNHKLLRRINRQENI